MSDERTGTSSQQSPDARAPVASSEPSLDDLLEEFEAANTSPSKTQQKSNEEPASFQRDASQNCASRSDTVNGAEELRTWAQKVDKERLERREREDSAGVLVEANAKVAGFANFTRRSAQSKRERG